MQSKYVLQLFGAKRDSALISLPITMFLNPPLVYIYYISILLNIKYFNIYYISIFMDGTGKISYKINCTS